MPLISKDWIQGFHDAEGHGLDPAPLVEAAFLAHELLEVLTDAAMVLEEIAEAYWDPEAGDPVKRIQSCAQRGLEAIKKSGVIAKAIEKRN